MKKINILQKNEDFNRIIQNNKAYKYRDYIIYKESNKDKPYQIGISVGKKIGNAVTRNKIKRQLKSIIDNYPIKKGYNCIIIVRKSILQKQYAQMIIELKDALEKMNLMEENK